MTTMPFQSETSNKTKVLIFLIPNAERPDSFGIVSIPSIHLNLVAYLNSSVFFLALQSFLLPLSQFLVLMYP